jgi:hypothetical protein
MTEAELDALVRRYAKGDLCWQDLRALGVDSYFDVLGSLGRQGLRYPIAAMTGPNVDIRRRGIAMLEAALDRIAPRAADSDGGHGP